MSSLVRINTEDSNAIFNETLSEDFIIEENSSIALQSATFTRNSSQLELHPNNIRVTFRADVDDLTNNHFDNIEIEDLTRGVPDGVVNASNFPNFLKNIGSTMNDVLSPFLAKESGLEARVFATQSRKVSIQLIKANPLKWTTANPDIEHTLSFEPHVEVTNAPSVSVAQRGGDGAIYSLGKNGTEIETPDGLLNINKAYVYSKVPVGHGAKYCSAKVLRNITNQATQQEFVTPPNSANPLGIKETTFDPNVTGQSGFVIGMVDNDGYQKLQTGVFTTDDMYAFCGINNNAGRYFFGYGDNTFKTDAEVTAGLTNFKYSIPAVGAIGHPIPALDDKLGIAIDNGRITFFRQVANPATLTANLNRRTADETRHLDYNRQYYWVMCFIGNQGHTRLSEVEGINDPYFTQPNGLLTTDFATFNNQAALGALPPHDTTPIEPVFRFNYRLPSGALFQNTELSNFLGFTGELPLLPFEENPINTFFFTAAQTAHQQLGFESYIVILNNVPLEAYDTEISGKKNILYTIVNKIENNNGVPLDTHIAFNSQYPIFMKIDNKNRLSLRQIQARIVNEHHELIDTIGISSLTMLIRKD